MLQSATSMEADGDDLFEDPFSPKRAGSPKVAVHGGLDGATPNRRDRERTPPRQRARVEPETFTPGGAAAESDSRLDEAIRRANETLTRFAAAQHQAQALG